MGVDFGGTSIKVGLVNGKGQVTSLQELSSGPAMKPQRFLDGVTRAVNVFAKSLGLPTSRLRGVGVGTPGPVDAARGVVHTLVNVPGWHEVPLGRELARRLRCRCVIDNDVNLFTLGEWRLGAGQGAGHLVGVTLGTGVGGGLILDGALYRGAWGAAGEIGHMLIDPNGERCGCGARGCLEAHVGTAAILRMGARAIQHGAEPLRTLVRQARCALTPALVASAAHEGDRAAQRIWQTVGTSLGVGLANVVNLLNPDRIVIGGGVANAWPFFSPALTARLRAQAMTGSARAVRVVRARLGNSSGVVGAAMLVWNETRGEG